VLPNIPIKNAELPFSNTLLNAGPDRAIEDDGWMTATFVAFSLCADG
jgi:hypothetical protein